MRILCTFNGGCIFECNNAFNGFRCEINWPTVQFGCDLNCHLQRNRADGHITGPVSTVHCVASADRRRRRVHAVSSSLRVPSVFHPLPLATRHTFTHITGISKFSYLHTHLWHSLSPIISGKSSHLPLYVGVPFYSSTQGRKVGYLKRRDNGWDLMSTMQNNQLSQPATSING